MTWANKDVWMPPKEDNIGLSISGIRKFYDVDRDKEKISGHDLKERREDSKGNV